MSEMGFVRDGSRRTSPSCRTCYANSLPRLAARAESAAMV
jgi:hypothetical protein